jgi:hypothetical protein
MASGAPFLVLRGHGFFILRGALLGKRDGELKGGNNIGAS